MILNINDDVSNDMLNKIIEALNTLEKGSKLFIYLCSTGGDADLIEAIINLINNNADLIELVAYGNIYSAAFDIFFRVECHKIILAGTMGMCHYSKTAININEHGRPYDKVDYANKMWTKSHKEYTIAFCKRLGMTEREISEVRQGKDVYFQPKRMQEFLKASQQNTNA